MKKIAILQSNYIPWKGYFDLVSAVDEFIVYDEVQYTKNDWRNRNLIKTPQGAQWLTIPVKSKGKFGQTIKNTELNDQRWADQHLKSLVLNYRKAPHFTAIYSLIEPLYKSSYQTISEVNLRFMQKICDYLNIPTKITCSWDYQATDYKTDFPQTERLVYLCQQAGGTEYISGPAAQSYIATPLFNEANISLRWFDYQGYPEYPQLWGAFTHTVSVLDLLFNCGPDSANYMRHSQQ
jgi:hypothetical protein